MVNCVDNVDLRICSMEYCRKAVAKIVKDSEMEDRSDGFPKFDLSDIKLGKMLGKGGFCEVSEVLAMESNPKKKNKSSSRSVVEGLNFEDKVEISCSAADKCICADGASQYALKCLRVDVSDDAALFIRGMVDLAIETAYLSCLDHPNIIKLRATADSDAFVNSNYFIVVDRLHDTLEKRILRWHKKLDRLSVAGRLFMDRRGQKVAAFYGERIAAACDVASAVAYLHKKKIAYRDLKPDNIGFDFHDDIKLFDFGLSKQLKNAFRREDGLYNLTEMTGSPRYMAPEVANGMPYNEKCDCYSFAILLWQILSTVEPFALHTVKSLREKVYNGISRPKIERSWSNSVKDCLNRNWSADISERWSMYEIELTLKSEVEPFHAVSRSSPF